MTGPTTALDGRRAEAFFAALMAKTGGYVPGWQPAPGQPGQALLQIYARYLEALAERAARAPEKNRAAFFDQLGINLLPAQAAVAPVVFTPIRQVGDSRVPARTQVAATIPGRDQPLVFETRSPIALAAAQLMQVASLWPAKDAWADHTQSALGNQPFVLFEGLKPTPHELYIAHATHFALSGEATVDVQFELARPGSAPLTLEWQYWDGEAWRTFKPFKPAGEATSDDSLDGTDGLTRNGTVHLVADCAKSELSRVNGVLSHWIRARLMEPLPPDPAVILPLVDRISISTSLANAGLVPDTSLVDSVELDLTKSFFPFGQQPQPGTAFYISSAEALGKPGAVVTITAVDAPTPADNAGAGATAGASPSLVTEYWDGTRWSDLGLASADLVTFAGGGSVSFTVPANLEPAKVATRDGYWIRLRVESGGFFRTRTITWTDGSVTNTVVVSETVPPALKDFELEYTYTSPKDSPTACVSFNDFQWTDRTAQARWRGTPFEPFAFTADRTPALYLGFDRPLPGDLVSLYFDIEEELDAQPPMLRWEAFDGREWLPLAVADETANLSRPGMVAIPWPGERPRAVGEAVIASGTGVLLANAQQASSFQVGDRVEVGEAGKGELRTVTAVGGETITLHAPLEKVSQRVPVAVAQLPRFGRPGTWLRARLQADGEPLHSRILGVYLNAAWAEQVSTYENEVIGSGTGDVNQAAFFRQSPVLPGEILEIRELSGARAPVELPMLQREMAAAGIDTSSIRTVADARTGVVTEVWVRWEQRDNLFFSGSADRHYMIERTRGRVIFGDGVHGRVPPAGADNIRALRYTSGGGTVGNVPAGALNQLLSGVPAQKVTNPRAAESGAESETLDEVQERAPQVIRHRNQALSLADYEALARQASPAVALARALPTTHASGRPATGWVKVIVQPHSHDPQPQPSFGLRRRVLEYLLGRIPASIGSQVKVVGPDYLPVGVEVVVAPSDPARAGEVHDAVLAALRAFLQPVFGGPDGNGWPFGRDVYASDVAAVVETVPGVDYVSQINLMLDGSPRGDVVPVPPDRIVVAGQIRVTLSGAEA